MSEFLQRRIRREFANMMPQLEARVSELLAAGEEDDDLDALAVAFFELPEKYRRWFKELIR